MLVGFFVYYPYTPKFFWDNVKIIEQRLDILLYSAYLWYMMREKLILLILFLMATGHPCRMRVLAISVRHLPKTEISFKPL